MFIKLHDRHQKGFTLVELIIVLAIIGILTALAISRISYNRTKAAKTTCNGIMGDIKKAYEAYYADSGNKLEGFLDPGGQIITQGYMAGNPKQPHGANQLATGTNGRYAIDWNTTGIAFGTPVGTAEVARVQCAWIGLAGDEQQAVFPDGH